MNTKFEDIFSLFFSQIDDYTFASASDELIQYELEKYLTNSYMSVYHMMGSLDIDFEGKEFSRELTMMEKIIFAKSMSAEWTLKKLNSEELMVKSIGDRDYKAIQGFTYLKQLREEYNSKLKDIDRAIIDYTYNNEDMSGGLFNA